MSRIAQPKARMSDQRFGYLMLSPAIVFVLSMAVYPVLRLLWLSFFTQNLATHLEPQFAGVANYLRVLNDGHYWQTVRTTALFTLLAVSTELLLGLGLALLLNETFHGRPVARAATLVPWALPTAVLALAWAWIFNDQYGVFNDLLLRLGLLSKPVAWLGRGSTALFAVLCADVWKTTPFMMFILLAGLQNIPRDLYEAVHVDGAKTWNSFRLITLPLLMPSILLALMFRTLQSVGIFDLIYVMTGGGPGGATETVAIYNYNTFLRYLDFGYGATIMVVTFFVTGLFGLLLYWPLSRLTAR
jgi:multiple sugar transport system permease protein